MKKMLSVLLLAGVLLGATLTPVYAAWEKIKEEPQGTYYIDPSTYKCSCTDRTLYFKLKQVPTHSNAKYIMNNLKLSFTGSDKYLVFNYATRYYNSGIVEDVQLPPVHVGKVFKSGSGLDVAVQKVYIYCGSYCKRESF